MWNRTNRMKNVKHAGASPISEADFQWAGGLTV
jgi:hypothetical protein